MIAEICERFGWTYFEYQEQPAWFVELIIEKIKTEAREMERREKEKIS
jgi:hypothetical protein